MRSCLRVPRLFVPQEYERWVAPACDVTPSYFERASLSSGATAFCCMVPDFFRGEREEEGEEEDRFLIMRDKMYAALEAGDLVRLGRGLLLVSRETSHGLRRGVLAAIDLEEVREEGAVRLTTETYEPLVASRAQERKHALLELPHTLLCYRDRRDKLLRSAEQNDALEEVYEISTPWCKLSAQFIPAFAAEETLHDLIHYGDKFFGVLDGNHTLAAARRQWEWVKQSISPAEARNHPARFTLAEFVNFYDPAVVFEDKIGGGVIPKEEILSVWKSGKRLPAKSTGPCEADRRCTLEAREITYD